MIHRYLPAALITSITAIVVTWLARSWGQTIWFALCINWIMMAWAITLGRVLEHPKGAFNGIALHFPERYFATRSFEKGGRIYDYLGVRWFRRWLRPLLWKLKPGQLRSGSDARQAMMQATRNPEAGHLVMFIPIFGITIWAMSRDWWGAAVWMLFFNLLHSGYPIMSMRQLRARLDRAA